MINPQNYAALYDFSTIERAVQSYFCTADAFVKPPGEDDPTRGEWSAGTGNIAFFTAFEMAVFKKSRPRVAVFLNAINPIGHWMVDGNQAIRNTMWKATLRLDVLTEPKYALHNSLRSMTAAMGEMICPQVQDTTIKLGANQFSDTFQIALCQMQNGDTGINQDEGAFQSTLNYTITFGLPEQAILAVV